MKRLFLTVAFLFCAQTVFAQPVVNPTSSYFWEQPATNLAQAQAYRYEVELDGGAPVVLTSTTCSGTASPFTCTRVLQAMTSGNHSARVRAVDISDAANPFAGAFGNAFTFTMRAAPGTPINGRVGPTPP